MGIEDTRAANILNELRVFISGTTRSSKCNELELTKTALNLLQTLPASRDAVLEYFCTIFDAAVKKYVALLEKEKPSNCQSTSNQQEDAVVNEIHSVLCNFVSSSPEAWAPIISSWSLQLLGQVSSHYNQLPSSVGLNEALHWWMSCKAARTLVDITTQCLSCLIYSDTETCINALLDTSVAHSPHFDWVVAHVGNSFPKTVITRVLSCGLKDFCAKKKLQSSSSSSSSKSAKLNSVVGILGHLASSHFTDIRKALLELFENSKADGAQYRCAVIPFLLQLASKSQTLLKALSTDVLHTLDMKTLSKLAEFAPKWKTYFRNDTQKLEDLIIHLALGCEKGGAKIISLLLDGTTYPEPNIADRCNVLLELLLEDIDVQLRSYKSTTIPFLESIKAEMRQVQHLLLSDNLLKQQTACRLFKLMGSVNPPVIIELSSYLLVRGTTSAHRATLLDLVKSNSFGNLSEDKNLLALAIEEALRLTSGQFAEISRQNSGVDSRLLWENLAELIRYELSCDTSAISDQVVCKAVVENLFPLSDLLSSCYDPETLHAITLAIELLPLSSISSLPLQLMLRLTKNCVKYFLVCVNQNDRWKKSINCHRACNLLTKFCCRSSPARALAIRELLESSLFLSASSLFGASKKKMLKDPKQGYLLMEQNYRLGTTTILAQRQSSVFGNGVAGHDKKEQMVEVGLDEDVVNENTMYLIKAIRACCMDMTRSSAEVRNNISLDAVIQVSLLMVELISPDVMYNGLPWPEEEFCKVTIERDVHIRKVFDQLPLAWKLLDFVARNQPALCYCSVLLRALAATLKSQWSSTSTSDSKAVLAATVRLLEIMSLGQLLPPPLSSLQLVIPHLTAAEVVIILQDCVWSYMRDNVPSPALFTRDPRTGFMWRDPNLEKPSTQYTETFRLILQNNIKRFSNAVMTIRKVCFLGADVIAAATASAIALKCPEIEVTVMDDSVDTAMKWNLGKIPVHEAGLEEAIKKVRNKNLFFTTSSKGPVKEADLVFVCCNFILLDEAVGEGKPRSNGVLFIENAARFVAACAESPKIVVVRSVGHVAMAEALGLIVQANKRPEIPITVITNPPFLLEGTVMEDVLSPGRVVIGGIETKEGATAVDELVTLYLNWIPREKIVTTDLKSAELSRVMTSALIAQKITSICSFVEICEATKADIQEVVKIVGLDSRIGSAFLDPFAGFSGSIFHRDVGHLVDLCKALDLYEVADYWQEIIVASEYQRNRLLQRMARCFFNNVRNKKIAIFGALYPKHAVSIWDSPTFYISSALLDECSKLTVCDSPENLSRIKEDMKRVCASKAENPIEKVSVVKDPYEAASGAHGIVICSDLDLFKDVDYKKIHESMTKPACIFDTRQLLRQHKLKEIGFNVQTIGKHS